MHVVAYYMKGTKEGSAIVMMDDSSAEHNALHQVWPHARLLLCTFQFL